MRLCVAMMCRAAAAVAIFDEENISDLVQAEA